MDTEKGRDERWFAYWLEETEPAERAQIEAEMARSPKEAAELKRIFEETVTWAKRPEEGQTRTLHRPWQSDAPRAVRARAGLLKRAGAFAVRPLPWAVAALVLLALTQTHFSFTLGDSTLTWGRQGVGLEEDASSMLLSLGDRIHQLEANTVEQRNAIEVFMERTFSLEEEFSEVALALFRNQQLESRTRQEDMVRMMQLSNSPAAFTWTDANYQDGDVVPADIRNNARR